MNFDRIRRGEAEVVEVDYYWRIATELSVIQNLSLMDIAISVLIIFSHYTAYFMVEYGTEIQTQVQLTRENDY